MPPSSSSRSTISAAHGFLIDGANIGAEFSVARRGDVNGDGRADVMLGAPFAGPNGAVFVVYGKADTLTVDVGSLAGKGFRIDGAPGDHAGQCGRARRRRRTATAAATS